MQPVRKVTYLAVLSRPAGETHAHVGTHQVDARGLMETRVVVALVLVLLAVVARVASHTLTPVVPRQVHTAAVVLTRFL